MGKTFEELLHQFGVPSEIIEQARQRQSQQGGHLRENLIALHAFTEETFSAKVSEKLRVPYVNLENLRVPDNVLEVLSREKAEKYLALPFEFNERHRRLSIAMADPSDMSSLDELKFVVGYTLIPHFAPEDELREAIRQKYSRFQDKQAVAAAWAAQHPSAPDAPGRGMIEVTVLNASDSAVSKLIGAIFTIAQARGADEIHIEPSLEKVRVLLKINGTLSELACYPKKLTTPLLTRMKRVIGFELGEQAPFFQTTHARVILPHNKEFDLAALVHSAAFQERLLIKISKRVSMASVDAFDLAEQPLQDLRTALSQPGGVVVVAGPQQSDLMTTLYGLLNTAKRFHAAALSVENPLRCRLDSVTQGQIHEDRGHTYTSYFRHLPEQHPDVVMVDTINDAALARDIFTLSNGTLALTSLAAADAAQAAMKLLLMTTAKLVIDHVTCIVAQRMVRTICDTCKEEVVLADAYRRKLGLSEEDRCYAGKGCEQCGYTGYQGTALLFEVVTFTDELRQRLTQPCTVKDLRSLCATSQVASLRDDGMRKVRQGLTTVQEVLKTTML